MCVNGRILFFRVDLNGFAMNVHNAVGSGFQEKIYQRALSLEFSDANLEFVREGEHEIFYKGCCIGTRRADFLVDNEIIVEIKAISSLLPEHFIQVKNYLTAFDKPLALLINFGAKSLEFKKIYKPNNKNYSKNSKERKKP